MFLQEQGWLMNIIRGLFANIDYIVYTLIKWVLFLIFDVSQLSANSELLNAIYHRTYLVLAVFMAFKLSFSFFQYVVNPDAMIDKKQGAGKLLQNVIIMLAALISLPNILFFGTNGKEGLLTRAQNAFLPMLPRLILGVDNGSSGSSTSTATDSSIEKVADEMAVEMLKAFFYPNREQLAEVCRENSKLNFKDLKEIETLDDFTSAVNLDCDAKEDKTVLLFFKSPKARYYIYSYTFIVSLIVGIIVLATLIGMLIDVAKRVFKLVILEIIAPIPIMSLIDPDAYQKGAFGAWVHQLINTYLEIFLKIGVLYVVLMLIQQITSKGLFKDYPNFENEPIRAALLTVALIIGLFQFAKEAPKFIKDSLGIKEKGDGGGTAGRFAGKTAGFMGGVAAGAAGGVLHGDMASGAMQGGQAALSAKPGQSAHAFRAGSDKAAQLRTGDDKYKTGFAASMQRRIGHSAGYSTQGYKNIATMAKQDAKDVKTVEAAVTSAQVDAGMAKDDFNSFTKSGMNYNDWYDSQDSATQARLTSNGLSKASMTGRNASNELAKYVRSKNQAVTSAQTAANSAKEKAEKSAKRQKEYESGMSSYGISKNHERGMVGAVYKAGRTASDAGTKYVKPQTDKFVNYVESRSGRVTGKVAEAVRTVESAHQQHELNEIANGTRVDNVRRDASGAFVDESIARTDRRAELDDQGTLQSRAKTFADGHLGSGPHDGHFGHGGSADGSAATGSANPSDNTHHGRPW